MFKSFLHFSKEMTQHIFYKGESATEGKSRPCSFSFVIKFLMNMQIKLTSTYSPKDIPIQTRSSVN